MEKSKASDSAETWMNRIRLDEPQWAQYRQIIISDMEPSEEYAEPHRKKNSKRDT